MDEWRLGCPREIAASLLLLVACRAQQLGLGDVAHDHRPLGLGEGAFLARLAIAFSVFW